MATTGIGRTLRQIRKARGKSLAVVAGLAGISPGYLSMLESGKRALDRRSLIVRLANALEVAPTELTGEMITAVGGLPQDAALAEVRRALMAVSLGVPDGEIIPADVLRGRVDDLVKAQQECRHGYVGEKLPGMIRDIHTTLDAHEEERAVLRLATLLHLQGTQAWLPVAGGSADLAWLAATLGQQAAERLDEPLSLALSAFGTAHGLIASGSFDLAGQTLASADAGTATREGLVVTGMLTLTSSMLAAARGDQGGLVAPLEQASELADSMGEGSEPWFGFGPSNVGVWRLSVALEAGEHADAARIAARVDPSALPSPFRQAAYWVNYGRAVAKLPKQRDKAVMMLHKAEQISPARVHRNPLARETLSELLSKAKQDAVGRELRGMAYRAGLPV
ncbi:helix-turn-helix domain-containing protein [Amycolatopsis nigrescens]|uniref:helix-turn-helix domain-containing protein n=1 Tax=Amycolatopsis nigrescens TaxID=381445 RepID=UPI000A07949A|nr:helix-turn-helix transcriptional regulator [Amycolatopsis nigrescens]